MPLITVIRKQASLFISSFAIIAMMIALVMVPTASKAEMGLQTVASHALIVDAQTGSVIFEKNSMEQMPTSSMSKVMTMLVIFDALKDGRLSLDDKLLVSTKAWRKGGSKMFVGEKTRVSVEDLIKGVIVQSGNDACIVLAEGLAGSEDAFVQLINQKAAEIGMVNSNFENATGWPDPNHYSTARDLLKMSLYLIYNYPEFYDYYSMKEFTYNDIKQNNRNPLLYRNLGADGIKTGHTEAAGYGLIGSAVQNDRRIVMIVNGLDTSKLRRSESVRLLAWAFNNTQNITLAKAGETIAKAAVWLGQDRSLPLVLKQDLNATIKNDTRDQIESSVILEEPIQAPILKGDKLGTLKVTLPDGSALERPLLAGKDVQKLGIFGQAVEKIRYLAVGLEQ